MITPTTLGFIWALSQAVAPPLPMPEGEIRTFDGIEFVWCRAGRFTMGTDTGYFDERPARQIHITEGFFIGRYEITQEQWMKVMGENPSTFSDPGLPVDTITHIQAMEFAEKLSEATGARYRLPTEAEWEFACRAGTQTKYSFGDEVEALGDHAWFRENSAETTHVPGEKKPNPWGIYDMHGNVAEWCSDWYVSGYDPDDTTDPKGPDQIRDAVVRGGSWADSPGYLKSSARFRMNFIFARNHIGLRLVREKD